MFKTTQEIKNFFFLDKIDRSWIFFFNIQQVQEQLSSILVEIEEQERILPERENILRVFTFSLDEIKVVIVGQDPYYLKGVPDGIAFSTQKKKFIPLTLQNIFKELSTDINCRHLRNDGSLDNWASQGVFLINTALTVVQGIPLSHTKIWRDFTGLLIKFINDSKSDLIWVFWGRKAKEIGERHQINMKLSFSSAHPSPLSARFGFFGSRPFSLVNQKLIQLNKIPIKWCLVCD